MHTSLAQNAMRQLLGIFMVIAGIGHLTFQRAEFLAQVPSWLSSNSGFMDFVVLASGALEIGLGIALFFATNKKAHVGLALAIFLILIFPGNISQYVNGISAFGLDTDTKRLVRLFFQPVLVAWAMWSSGAWKTFFAKKNEASNQSFFDFEAKLLSGKSVSMSLYKGKTIIVVNTASKCGLTPHYKGLENLYQKHKDRGLVILGFPCNQFANQESGSAKDIEEFCQINYGVSFTMFDKIEVNGKNAHPIFKYLKAHLPGIIGGKIEWNFTKFVIDKNGKPVHRFFPATTPEKMERFIEKIL
jgi:glutathione peroxidase-family protein/uncharacterized membrane protein